MDEKGQFSSAAAFIFVFSVLMLLFVFLLPMLQNQAIQYYAAQEDIVADSLERSNDIQDPAVKQSFQETLQLSQDTQVSNVEILGLAIIYGALLIIIIIAAAIFLNGRRTTQAGIIG